MRLSIHLLLFTCAFATQCEANAVDVSPMLEHQRIAECVVRDSDGASGSEQLSLIQRNAQAQAVAKAAFAKVANDAPESQRTLAVEVQLANLAATEQAMQKRLASLEAKLKDSQRVGQSDRDRSGHEHVAQTKEASSFNVSRTAMGQNFTTAAKSALLKIHKKVHHVFSTRDWDGPHPLLKRNITVMAILVLVVLPLAFLTCYCFDPVDTDEGDELHGSPRDSIQYRRNEALPDDTLGMMICVLVRDTQFLVLETTNRFKHLARILGTAAILGLNQTMQIYFILCICSFVVPMYVQNLRDAYEKYEVIMYDNHTLSANGETRGIPGWFNASEFENLGEELTATICETPFSQPLFFMPLLLIWTLRCMREIKAAVDLLFLLIVKMPTIDTLVDSLDTRVEEDAGKKFVIKVIVGLPLGMKAVILFLILLPRLAITSFICWMGTRWLAASPDLGELVLNTVAVEFLLLIKDLFYAVLVSERNKRDLRQTEVRPSTKVEKVSYWLFLSSLGWFFASCVWVVFYCMYFQMVLVEYRWDASVQCTNWLHSAFPKDIV